MARAIDVDDINLPRWRLDGEHAFEALVGVISARGTLSVPKNDVQRFVHLKSVINTEIGREVFGRGMSAFRRRILDEPHAFPLRAYESSGSFSLQSNLIALWKSVGRFAWA